jgi:AcrR family transcriptional regulator
MIAGAADLIRRRGLNATSVREVVRYTKTPRGSIGHHFPNGRQQLIEEAIQFAGDGCTAPLRKLVIHRGTVAGLRAFVDLFRQTLIDSNFEAGCPVVAVAVEQYIGEDGNPDTEIQNRLLEMANGIFEEWQGILRSSLRKEGVSTRKAQRLATLIVSAVEGTLALCRASHSTRPLDDVQSELELLLSSVIPDRFEE